MDSLLAGKLPPFQGRLACHCDVQRRCVVKNIPGIVKAIPGSGETVRLPAGITVRLQPGISFVFTPESFSRLPRNPFRLRPESPSLSRE
jgi:hypothetical protein